MNKTYGTEFTSNFEFPIDLQLKGKSIKDLAIVQLNMEDVSSTTKNDVTLTKNANGSWTLNGTASAGFTQKLGTVPTLTAGHKYLIKGLDRDTSTDYEYYLTDTRTFFIAGNKKAGTIALYNDDDSANNIGLVVRAGVTFNNVTIWPQLFDLTAMGWEDITLDQFNALFTEKYYKYNSTQDTQKIRSTGYCMLQKTSVNQVLQDLPIGYPQGWYAAGSYMNITKVNRKYNAKITTKPTSQNNIFFILTPDKITLSTDNRYLVLTKVTSSKTVDLNVILGGKYADNTFTITTPNKPVLASFIIKPMNATAGTTGLRFGGNNTYENLDVGDHVSFEDTMIINLTSLYGDRADYITANDYIRDFGIEYNEFTLHSKYSSDIKNLSLFGIPDESTKCVMNQLIENGSFDTSYRWSSSTNSSLEVKDNIAYLKLNTNEGSAYLYHTMRTAVTENHKYLFCANIKSAKVTRAWISCGGSYYYSDQIIDVPANTWTKGQFIAQASSTSAAFFLYPNYSGNYLTAGDIVQIKDVQVIDLTIMFGAGNEPTTVDSVSTSIKDKYHNYSAGYFDYYKYNINDLYHNGKYTKRIGVIDLGTLNWEYQPYHERFYSIGLANIIHKTSGENEVPNMLCTKYTTNKMINMGLNGTDKSITAYITGYIFIKDLNYTDSASLKQSLSGVLLYYELENEVTLEGKINLFDGETLNGYYDNVGRYVYHASTLCTKNMIKVKPSTQYDISWKYRAGGNINVYLYNKDKGFITNRTVSTGPCGYVSLLTTADTYYINIDSTYSNGTYYEYDLSVCEANNATKYCYYEPNKSFKSAKGINRLYITDYDRIVDLGSFSYNTTSDGIVQRSISDNFPQGSYSNIGELISNNYLQTNYNYMYGKKLENSIATVNGSIGIYDLDLIGKTASEIKAYMAGTKVIYRSNSLTTAYSSFYDDIVIGYQDIKSFTKNRKPVIYMRRSNGKLVNTMKDSQDRVVYKIPELPSAYNQIPGIYSQGEAKLSLGISDFDYCDITLKLKERTYTYNTLIGADDRNTVGSTRYNYIEANGNIVKAYYTLNGSIKEKAFHFNYDETFKITCDYQHDELTSDFELFKASVLGSDFQVYEINFYKDNKLIRKLIPCIRVEDSKCGLYDVVNGSFYCKTLGSGTVEPIIYEEN